MRSLILLSLAALSLACQGTPASSPALPDVSAAAPARRSEPVAATPEALGVGDSAGFEPWAAHGDYEQRF
jgi:hypothetical protein